MADNLFATIGSTVMQTKLHLLKTGVETSLLLLNELFSFAVLMVNLKEQHSLMTCMWSNPTMNQLAGWLAVTSCLIIVPSSVLGLQDKIMDFIRFFFKIACETLGLRVNLRSFRDYKHRRNCYIYLVSSLV